MALLRTFPLFLGKALSAGDSATSDPYYIGDITDQGVFSISGKVVAGTAGTAGTTVITYSLSILRDGTFVTPSSATPIGTFGTAIATDVRSFEPELCAWIKIIATQAGSGTAGKDSLVTAELNVQ